MILDKNGKLFGKISIIDIFAVLIIIVAIAGISIRFTSKASNNAKQKVNLSYVVKIEGVRQYTVDAFANKGKLIDPKQKCEVGEITDVNFEPQAMQRFDSDGNMVYADVPERYTVLVSVASVGKESDNSYFVGNDIELSVGSTIKLATKYVNSSGKVISIEKK